MNSQKTDIDFLINEKKGAGQGQSEDWDIELPDNLSSDDFDPGEGPPDSEIDFFSKKIALEEGSAV